MKKLLFIFLAFISIQAGAQSFYKGALVTDLNYGIDIYRVHYHYQLKGTNITSDKYDAAGSKSFSVGGQYGLAKWFGLGLRVKIDNYITSKDSITGITPTASGVEIGVITDFHVVRKQHFNLSLGLDLGYSNFIYRTHDAATTEVYGTGSWTNFHIIPRYYFGRFGLNFALNFPKINYANMTSNNSTINTYVVSSWKASGFGFSFGVQYRFFNSK